MSSVIPNAARSARDCGGGSDSMPSRNGINSWCSAAKPRCISDSMPTRRNTSKSPADDATDSSKHVLPMPASPWTTSTPLRPLPRLLDDTAELGLLGLAPNQRDHTTTIHTSSTRTRPSWKSRDPQHFQAGDPRAIEPTLGLRTGREPAHPSGSASRRGARGGDRTRTPRREGGFKPPASASSATRAGGGSPYRRASCGAGPPGSDLGRVGQDAERVVRVDGPHRHPDADRQLDEGG